MAPDNSPPESPSSGSGRSLKARTIRGTLVTVAGHGFSRVLGLGSNIVLSRLLFPEAFGVMALVIMLLTGLQMISDVGIQPSVIQHRRGNEPAFLDTAWTIQVIRGGGIWVIAVLLAVPFARFYGDQQLVSLVPAALAGSLLSGLYSTKLITLNRQLELDRLVVIDVAARVAAVTAMIVYGAVFRSVWALVVGGLTEAGVRMILSHLAIPGRNNWFGWDREAARDIFKFGRWIFLSTLITFFAVRLDVVLLGKLIPLELLGVYSIALTVGRNLAEVAGKVTSMVVLPAFSSSAREGHDALVASFVRSRRTLLPVGITAFLAAALLAPAFFYFIYDERYHAAGWMAQLTMATLWLTFIQNASSRALLAVGDSRSLALANSVRLVATAAAALGGYSFGGFPGFLVGISVGAATGHATVVILLERRGLHCARLDLAYTSSGVALTLACAFGSEWVAQAFALSSSAPVSLAFATVVLPPLSLWVLLRVKKEMRN